MNQQLKFLSILVGLTCALSARVALPATALPGQNAEEVMRWSDQHPLIAALMPSLKLQTAEPDLFSTSKCTGHELSFAVWSPKGLVLRELVDYRSSDPSFDFSRKNSAGVNLIQQVYDSAIAQDFAASSLVYQGTSKTLRPSFYKGRRFGYITEHFLNRSREGFSQKPNVSQLTLVPLSQLDNEIQLNKRQYSGQFW